MRSSMPDQANPVGKARPRRGFAGSVRPMHEKSPLRAADSPAPQYPIESVDNALKLLLLLAEQPEIRLSEATRYLGVASSTAHRVLAMLAYRGFVRQDTVSKAYRAGPALTEVAFAVLRRNDIQAIATPVLHRLSGLLRETVDVAMLDGATVRFVAAVEGPTGVRVASRLGRSLPAHCTSAGKVMLAQLPQPELHEVLPDELLERTTPRTLGSRAALEAELSQIRDRGYAVNREESEEGVAAISVVIPTYPPGPPLALNAAAPQHRLTKSRYARISAELARAAKAIGKGLY